MSKNRTFKPRYYQKMIQNEFLINRCEIRMKCNQLRSFKKRGDVNELGSCRQS